MCHGAFLKVHGAFFVWFLVGQDRAPVFISTRNCQELDVLRNPTFLNRPYHRVPLIKPTHGSPSRQQHSTVATQLSPTRAKWQEMDVFQFLDPEIGNLVTVHVLMDQISTSY